MSDSKHLIRHHKHIHHLYVKIRDPDNKVHLIRFDLDDTDLKLFGIVDYLIEKGMISAMDADLFNYKIVEICFKDYVEVIVFELPSVITRENYSRNETNIDELVGFAEIGKWPCEQEGNDSRITEQYGICTDE